MRLSKYFNIISTYAARPAHESAFKKGVGIRFDEARADEEMASNQRRSSGILKVNEADANTMALAIG
jgi:hypothetical protein